MKTEWRCTYVTWERLDTITSRCIYNQTQMLMRGEIEFDPGMSHFCQQQPTLRHSTRGFAQFFPVFPSSWRRFIATCRQHSEEAPIGKCWDLNNGERNVFLLKRTNVECRTHWAPLITSNCRDCRLQSVLDKKWFSKFMQGSGQPALLPETHFGASVFFPLHFFHSCQLWAKTHTHKKTNQKFKVRLKR